MIVYRMIVCGALTAVVLAVALPGNSAAWGQEKYEPESPEVQAMIERGLNYLANAPVMGYEDVLLAGVAAHKASYYTMPDPREHPMVRRAIDQLVEDLSTGEPLSRRTDFSANYVPALSLAFLLDVDPIAHEPQIRRLLDYLLEQQQESGAWGYRAYPNYGDTSQMQYIGLALWSAANQGFDVPPEAGRRALEWMVNNQDGSGGWIYTIPPMGGAGRTPDVEIRHSLVASGGGTVYVLAEWLQLATQQSAQARQQRDMAQLTADLELRLPASVSVYRPDAPDQVVGQAKVQFDISRLRQSMARSNTWLRNNYRMDPPGWTFYYLYAFERYASLRELVDGDMAGMDDWYDRGVEFLMRSQQSNGSWPMPQVYGHNTRSSTALAILFLTRSMRQSLGVGADGLLIGGEGFREDEQLRQDRRGRILGAEVERDIGQLLVLLDDPNDEALEEFVRQVEDLNLQQTEISRTAQLAQLRGLVRHRQFEYRKVAVVLIGQQRNLDNVPALIYALSDPNLEIARLAHRGLQFISRKVDSIPASANPDESEMRLLKQAWTDWYLSIRPGARLIEDEMRSER